MSEERWLPVVGYEGFYVVSDMGHVFSCKSGRLLKGGPAHGGYTCFVLLGPRGTHDRGKTFNLHKLMMDAFVGPLPKGMMTRHLDGNPQNNVLSNLAYGTPKENSQDMVRHGRSARDRITHCPQGHAYDEANTQWKSKGDNPHYGRGCKACDKERWARAHPPKIPKTHCKHGHEFTPENTLWVGRTGTGRNCRACRDKRAADFRATHVEEQKIYFRERYLREKNR